MVYYIMQTDVKIKEEVKKARRQVFWRLHSFPWVLSIVCLLLIIFGLIINSRRTEGRYIAAEESIKASHVQKSLILSNLLEKTFYIMAVKEDHGLWSISDEGEVVFDWIDCKNRYQFLETVTNWVQKTILVTNIVIIEKTVTNIVIIEKTVIPEEHSRAFNYETIDSDEFRSTIRILAKSGIDVEESILSDLDLTIDAIFGKFFPDMRKEEKNFREEFRDRCHESIEQSLLGVKLYHKERMK